MNTSTPLRISSTLVLSVALASAAHASTPAPASCGLICPGDTPILISTIVGGGQYNGDGLTGPETRLSGPFETKYDSQGNLYFVDFSAHRIRMLDTNGLVHTVVGSGDDKSSPDGTPALQAGLFNTIGLCLDKTQKDALYWVESYDHIIRTLVGGKLVTVAGGGSSRLDGIAATDALLSFPAGCDFDSAGNLYFSDRHHYSIRKIDLGTPAHLISTVAGNGLDTNSGSGGPALQAGIGEVTNLVFDANDNLYLGASEYGVIRKIAPDLKLGNGAGIITTIAGTGTPGFNGDGAATSTQIGEYNSSLAFEPATGSLFFADYVNHRIRILDSSGFITTIAGDGVPAFNGDNQPAATAELYRPTGISFDPQGRLVFADYGNSRVRRLQRPIVYARPTVITYTGVNEGALGHEVALVALLTDGTNPIPGQVVSLTLGAQSCTGVTDGSGKLSCTLRLGQAPGSYTVIASYAGNSGTLLPAPDASAAFTILRDPTTIVYTGATFGEYSDTVTLSAAVSETGTGAAVGNGAIVTLSMGTQWCNATVSAGVASCPINVSLTAGSYPIVASFAGNAEYAPSQASGSALIFRVSADDTSIAYTGPTLFAAGSAVTVSGRLTDQSDGAPLAGQLLTLKVGTAAPCTGTTDATGVASCSLTVAASQMGTTAVSVSFAGNGFYRPAAASALALAFAYAPGGGSFVIADTAAKTGAAVTYWGAQWWKINAPSGGAAPAAFKGYADLPVQPACGAAFTTRPGNSSRPPASVPEYMAVIATSSVTQSGSTLSGTSPRIVIVHTAPGYAPDPGHAGTGTVVAVLCP